MTRPWHEVFNIESRRAASRMWRSEFEVEAKIGAYDHYLREKYNATIKPAVPIKIVHIKLNRQGYTSGGQYYGNGDQKVDLEMNDPRPEAMGDLGDARRDRAPSSGQAATRRVRSGLCTAVFMDQEEQ